MKSTLKTTSRTGWEAHIGLDYAVVTAHGENTDTASVRVFGDDAERLAELIASLLNLTIPVGGAASEPAAENNVNWECGDEELQAQAALSVIRLNKVADCAAMEKIEGLIHSAGKQFLLDTLIGDAVPW